MRIYSASSFIEILPFLGPLSDAYKLIGQLNYNSRKTWQDNISMFDKIIPKRKTIKTLYTDFGEKYIEILNKNPIIYMIFELEPLVISTDDQYALLIKLFKSLINPKMIRFSSLSLMISSKDPFELIIKSFETRRATFY